MPKASNIKIYTIIFRPDTNFYTLPFRERLENLEKNIEYANQWFENRCEFNSKALFLAPEYLFKDFSKMFHERYYDSKQKNEYKQKLIQLSLNSSLIIIPGTMCWRKQKNPEDHFIYRNIAYFFYKGVVKKYHKHHPHSDFDDDFNPGIRPKGSISLEERFKFFKTGYRKDQPPESGLINLADLNIGIEICADHTHKLIENELLNKSNLNIDIHLIIADGIHHTNMRLINRQDVVFIKVERTEVFPTIIGHIKAGILGPFDYCSSPSIELANTIDEDKHEDALTFYELSGGFPKS